MSRQKIVGFAAAVAGMLLIALPAFAAVKPVTAVQVACVGTSVNARETALVGAVGTLTQSIKGAYATRAEALQQAYALTPVSSVKAAVKIAWSVFNGSIKSANATWKISRDAVWAQFKTAVKTCQAPAVTSDATMSSADVVVR